MGTRLAALMAGFLGTGRQTKPSSGSCKKITMKTDKNSRTQTTSGALSHPELAIPDTNSQGKPGKYRVQLFWRSTKVLFHVITANSLDEAEEKAFNITESDLPKAVLEGLDGELYIDTLEPMDDAPETPTRLTDNAHEGLNAADRNSVWSSHKLPGCLRSRKQALANGLQREVPTEYLQVMHNEWDMLLPSRVFLTRKVVNGFQICMSPFDEEGKVLIGCLWEILNVLDNAIGSSFERRIPFQVRLGVGKMAPLVTLHAVWSAADIDDPSHSITIMMPDEH